MSEPGAVREAAEARDRERRRDEARARIRRTGARVPLELRRELARRIREG